jgi:hypothetical protein
MRLTGEIFAVYLLDEATFADAKELLKKRVTSKLMHSTVVFYVNDKRVVDETSLVSSATAPIEIEIFVKRRFMYEKSAVFSMSVGFQRDLSKLKRKLSAEIKKLFGIDVTILRFMVGGSQVDGNLQVSCIPADEVICLESSPAPPTVTEKKQIRITVENGSTFAFYWFYFDPNLTLAQTEYEIRERAERMWGSKCTDIPLEFSLVPGSGDDPPTVLPKDRVKIGDLECEGDDRMLTVSRVRTVRRSGSSGLGWSLRRPPSVEEEKKTYKIVLHVPQRDSRDVVFEFKEDQTVGDAQEFIAEMFNVDEELVCLSFAGKELGYDFGLRSLARGTQKVNVYIQEMSDFLVQTAKGLKWITERTLGRSQRLSLGRSAASSAPE